MTDQTTDVALPDEAAVPARGAKKPTMAQMLERMHGEIARALPRHMSGERFTRVVLTQVRKTPRLTECTPESFFGALLTASALGLEPGVNGECYLVPYRDKSRGVTECELIVGYQGVAKLFWQHPMASRIDTGYVCANDDFDWSKGITRRLDHQPADGDRGPVTHYYAIVELSTGALQFDVFTADQIKALRRGKVGPSGDIPDPEHWMERKTALKQVLKLMPKAVELTQAMTVDEQPGSMKTAQMITEQAEPIDAEIIDDGPNIPEQRS